MRRVSKKVALVLCAAACSVVSLVGCSQTGPTEAQPSNLSSPSVSYPISSAEKSELADGTVTYDEYQAAFRRYQACDAKAGYKLLITGESNEVIHYSVPARAVDSGVDDRCDHTQFADVDTRWQISREDTSDQAADYGKCLQAAGIAPQATEGEKFHQLENAHIDPTQCYVNNGVMPTSSPGAGG